jgi:hypothetical protein
VKEEISMQWPSTPRLLAAVGLVVLAAATFAPAAAAVDTDIAISTTAVDFGTVAVGQTKQLPVTLTNTGGDPFTPHMAGGAPFTPEFTASQDCQLVALPPGGSCQIIYVFTPGARGTFSDMSNFTISETDSQQDGESFSVSLAGRGADPHARSVTLRLRGHLVARGRVSAADDFAGCEAGVAISIQRKRHGAWRIVDTSVTDPAGYYREWIPDRSGRYRALAGRSVVNSGLDICRRAISPVRTN